jgi:hypothetical protein
MRVTRRRIFLAGMEVPADLQWDAAGVICIFMQLI